MQVEARLPEALPDCLDRNQGYKKAYGWKELSREMQRAEARVMIDGVCERLRQELPEAVWFSIHDSIVCEPQHVGVVKAIIIDEMANIGLRPSLGDTDYNDGRELGRAA